MGHAVPDPLAVDAAEDLCLRVSAGQRRDVRRIADELERLWRQQGST